MPLFQLAPSIGNRLLFDVYVPISTMQRNRRSYLQYTMSTTTFEYPIAGPEGYVAEPCVPEDNETIRLMTKAGIEYVQTPDDAFANLADAGFPWTPNYVQVDGMRMHYIDVSPDDAASLNSSSPNEIVLMLHGQPSWSFLYRKMVPILVERGFRVICPDMLGMGRSDKPVEMMEHTYEKHVERMKSFITQVIPEALDEPTITLFGQDWGSLIGLRIAGDEPSWFRRAISANGLLPVLPPGVRPFNITNPINYNCSDTRTVVDMAMERRTSQPCSVIDQTCFGIWIYFALTNPYWIPSELLQLASATRLSNTTLAQYDAPYPTRTHTAAVRALPSMMAGIVEPEFGNTAAWESLQRFERPFLALAGELDPNLGSVQVQSNLYNNIAGASVHSFEHKRYANASHFIQEDVGEEMATYIADFVDGTPVDAIESSSVMPTAAPIAVTSSGVHGRNHSTSLSILLFIFTLRWILR
jgi:haloalkane dehalogenase